MLRKSGSSKIMAIITLGASIGLGATGCLGETNDEEMLDNAEMLDDDEMLDDEENVRQAMQPIVYGGHDYLFVLTPKNWNAAQTHCQLNGANLVTINTPAEETFLANEEALHGSGFWWIGASDQGIEGTWAWIDGTAPGPTNWADGEPNNANGNEDCAADNWSTTGQWNDRACGIASKFICERSSIPTSSSGSFSYIVSNTNNATQNTYNHSLTLYAGQTLTVGTCGVPGASFVGNTLLRLNSGPTEVTSNDNSCGGLGSNFSYIAGSTGSHTIRAGCYGNTACKGKVTWSIY